MVLYSTKRAWLSQRYPNSQRRSQTAARGVSTGAGPLHGGAARRSPMQCITRVSRHAARHSCLRARPPGPVGPRPSSHRAGRHRPLYNHRPYRESRLASAAVPPAGTVHLFSDLDVRARALVVRSGAATASRGTGRGLSTRGQRRGALGAIQPRIQRRRTVDDCDCMFSLS